MSQRCQRRRSSELSPRRPTRLQGRGRRTPRLPSAQPAFSWDHSRRWVSRRLTSFSALGARRSPTADRRAPAHLRPSPPSSARPRRFSTAWAEALQFGGEHARAIEVQERAFADTSGAVCGRRPRTGALACVPVRVRSRQRGRGQWLDGAGGEHAEGVRESAAHGWLILDRAPWTSDAAEREHCATAAIAIARRYGEQGPRVRCNGAPRRGVRRSGRVTEGMTLLDEAMAAVASGEVVGVGPAGEIYCRLLSACERATDVRRAEQWLVPRLDSRPGRLWCRRPAGRTMAGS